MAGRLAMSPRPVIVEGVCLQAVLERLSAPADATVYVKLYSSHGEWMDADECDVSIPVEDALRDLRSMVKRVSAAMGVVVNGLLHRIASPATMVQSSIFPPEVGCRTTGSAVVPIHPTGEEVVHEQC